MTWEEAALLLQLWAEDRVGSRQREELARARAIEDALAAGLKG